MHPHRGEAGALKCAKPPHKSDIKPRTSNPPWTTPILPCKLTTNTYHYWCFQFQVIAILTPHQGTFKGSLKALRRPLAKYKLISITLTTLAHATLVYMMNFVPNEVFDHGFMPFFVVEHHIITLYLDSSEGSPTKGMPNHGFLGEPPRNHFPKEWLFLVETIIVAHMNTRKVMHNIDCPMPCYTCLKAIPKYVFNKLASVKETKKIALFEYGCGGNVCPPFVDRTHFVHDRPHKVASLLNLAKSHICDQ